MTIFNKIAGMLATETQFPTLGARSTFRAKAEGNSIRITTKKGTQYGVSRRVVQEVAKRYRAASRSEKRKASHFTDPQWSDCPSRVTAPYVARLITESQKP
jgi:hypothetical protein